MVKSVVGVKVDVALVSALVAMILVGITPGALAATQQTGMTEVMFNIAPALEVIAWPDPAVTLDEAPPGAETMSHLSIVVKSNSSWGVQISSDSDDGMMREYDLSLGNYVLGGYRTGPVEFAEGREGPWFQVSRTPAALFTGQSPTGEAGRSLDFWIRVIPDFNATELADGRTYRIVLTYTAGVGY